MVVVEFAPRVDEAVNAAVQALAERARSASLPGVLSVVPTIRTVALHVDPLRTPWDELTRWVTQASASPAVVEGRPSELVDVSVHYGGEAGPDLHEVSRLTGLSESAVIEAHAGVVYRVFMMGFLPGFAYLGVLPNALRLPRRARPRTHVPAGSVAIAGELTGIYPTTSPGGWHVIGRTDLRPFDRSRERAFRFSVGTRVRFVPTGGAA